MSNDETVAWFRAEIDRSEVIIEALRAQLALRKQQYAYDLAEWERVGNAIMLCATGNEAPLSDSDVCGVIADLRAQVEIFRALWRDGIEQLNRKNDEIETTIGILGGNEYSDLVQLARTVAELCAE